MTEDKYELSTDSFAGKFKASDYVIIYNISGYPRYKYIPKSLVEYDYGDFMRKSNTYLNRLLENFKTLNPEQQKYNRKHQ